MRKLDYKLVAPGICIVATSYGLARYAYGLFLPIFRDTFGLSDSLLALTAACSYASYFMITVAGIYLSSRIAPRTSILLGGLAAAIGMAIIALAGSPWMLILGVTVAGVSPGLAYTPISEVIVAHVSAERQKGIYSIINSGTSLGVMMSGPIALLLGDTWRLAWALFALFGLISTLWCFAILPPIHTRTAANFGKISWKSAVRGDRGRLFVFAFLIGIATSIYWAFSVDLITNGSGEGVSFAGYNVAGVTFGQIFWTFVGLAGFAGAFAGSVVKRFGVIRSMSLFQTGIAAAIALIAITQTAAPVITSGLIFGAFFVFMAATLGMWSLELFEDAPAFGFGTAFLLLSAGQFAGPTLVSLLIDYLSLSNLFLMAAIASIAIVFLLPPMRTVNPTTEAGEGNR